VPSLVGVTDRIDEESVRVIVSEGRNNMRPILDASNEEIRAIYSYLTVTNPFGRGGGGGGGRGRGRGNAVALPPGPVVAQGGAPRPPLPGRYGGPFYPGIGGTAGNIPWPEDVAAAKLPTRYQTGYNVMATATKPPYTTITAYDLNTGEIKWQVPDGGVTPPPGANTNIPADSGSHMPRGGPLVTAGGLVFVATASDRTVRAYDRDNGSVVWKTDLPTGSEGVPASYEVNGRQYIVFPVAAGTGGFSIRFGGPGPAAGAAPVPGGPEGAAAAAQGRGRGGRGGPPPLQGSYIVYALPQK
jgi:hypothetical protein